jgi:tetratricopeptide (TPR) repeat protein
MAEVALRDYLNEIDNLIDRGSIEAALQHSRHILLQYPKAVEVYRLMGKALLEREDDRAAQDVFQRVLSVDPEDFVARVGLSIVHDRNNEVDQAVWHMERAFDIAPSNALIQGELRRLYARRDGAPPDRIPLTRDALARMYAQGDLNAEAISDLRELLREQPDRIDLQVEMAEVLWRDEQRVDASELTLKVLNTLPYCLKANLIIGAILRDSGANGESAEPFQRAQSVDPENMFAAAFFGGQGSLVQQPVLVDRLDLQTVSDLLESEELVEQAEAVPEWLRGVSDLEQPLLPESELEHAPRLAAGLHMPDVATEIPDWLQGLTAEPSGAEADVPDWLATLTGAAVAGAAAQALTDREKAEPEELAALPTDEETPDWISQLGSTGTLTAPGKIPPVVEGEQPDWMAQLRETPPAPYSETIPVSEDTQTPDWLAQIQASAPPLKESPAGEEPDWLAQLHAASGEAVAEPESSLDFGQAAAGAVGLAGLAGAALFAGREGEDEEAAAELEVPAPTVVEPVPEAALGVAEPTAAPEVPEEMPSADDALAFLAKLAAGKEDQLRAQAHEEADLRMDAIMGRKPAEPKPAEPVQEGKPAIRLATTGAAAAGLVAAATKLKNKLEEPEQPTSPAAAVASPLEVPEEMPSSDDALAFLAKLAAGKEVQLQAEAQREADVRMAAIMGRKPVEPVAEPVAQVPQPVEPAAPVATTAEVPEEMPSADDALAFLSRLAAGKEDQLRAEAQLEADARMDAIMGRKPAAAQPAPEEKPGAGLVAAAAIGAAAAVGLAATKKEEPTPPPEVPEDMPSADDALAFLAKLAAGKEDQLRAQAEQEAEVRMAAIMGRSAPLEPAKTIEPETSPTLEIESAEESTAWLADLSATAEPVPASELPDWLQEMHPSDETVTAEPASELPEWLRAMRPDESTSTPGLAALFEEESETELEAATPAAELPDWLRSMQPSTATGGLTLESLTIEDEEIEAAVTPTSELPDWLRSIRPTEPTLELEETVEEEETSLPLGALAGAAAFGLPATLGSEESVSAELEPSTEELLAELATLEQAASVAEIEPAQASIVLSHDWWAQAAEDTDEEPLQELPEPFLSPRARAAEKERGRAAVAAEKPKIEPSALPRTGPLHTVQTGPLPQTGPLVMPESVAPSPEVEALVARVSGDQKNYAARLELARTYWATGNREGAYTEYLELTNAGEYTKELMSDLDTIVEIHDLPDWHRMLGDVCMKAGKLSQALAHYRMALNEL